MKTKAQKADYLRFINDAALTARCFTSQLPKYIVDICRLVPMYKITGNLIFVQFVIFFMLKSLAKIKTDPALSNHNVYNI